MTPAPLVPADFAVPAGLRTELFVLEPLGVQHNEADHAAWTSSIQHIRQTPGFAGRTWPPDTMSLEQNAGDLARHARDFGDRTGFTYTVLDPASGDVIGCLYIYPARREGYDADVRSWVRADRAELDKPLYDAICQWLASSWPFARPDYAAR
ncbi:MAG TPA: N-acetyltransferase [Streptosporangiaceae bacterium]|nr:N-acetyltransferase [Streptosporangiaceae bacterium]